MQFVPCIRYCGGKRKQSEDIIARMPHKINTLFIPFLGGGSVMFQALNSNIQINNMVCTDIYAPLMRLWEFIQNDPDALLNDYNIRYENTRNGGEEYYNSVVEEFNRCSDIDMQALMFHYITRTCARGNLEYDEFGNFKTKFQNPSGDRDSMISPSQLKPIIMRWNACIKDVEFRCEPYEYILDDVKVGDYCFFDPPYVDGLWYKDHNMDYNKFFDFLRQLPCDYSITLNGDKDIYPIPDDCYTKHEYIYYGRKKKTPSGRPTGSRDSFWMKHTDNMDYSKDINNVRNNQRGEGGTIPQINNFKLLDDVIQEVVHTNERINDINTRLDKMMSILVGLNNK